MKDLFIEIEAAKKKYYPNVGCEMLINKNRITLQTSLFTMSFLQVVSELCEKYDVTFYILADRSEMILNIPIHNFEKTAE